MDIECKHHKNEEEGYHYKLDDKVTLWLCVDCNMNLAGEIAKQQAIETFLQKPNNNTTKE